MAILKTYKEINGNKLFKIYQDQDPVSPREWDNLGVMLCFHKVYSLGDKINLKSSEFGGWDEVKEYLKKNEGAKVILPLFLYDHSGLTMKIGSFNGTLPQGHAHFDSAQVGFIYATRKAIKKEKLTIKKAKDVLEGEVEVFNQYLQGQVYGYSLVELKKCETCGNISEEVKDSCGGYYGDLETSGILDNLDLKKFEEQET